MSCNVPPSNVGSHRKFFCRAFRKPAGQVYAEMRRETSSPFYSRPNNFSEKNRPRQNNDDDDDGLSKTLFRCFSRRERSKERKKGKERKKRRNDEEEIDETCTLKGNYRLLPNRQQPLAF